jgi:alpha-glucosidase
MALPGAYYLYQGEELGLPEVELGPELIEDPMHARSGGVDPGRDGCRIPLPWSGDAPPYGFSTGTVPTWLPQPSGWGSLTAEAEARDPGSMLSLYRSALRLRRGLPELGDGSLDWVELGPDVLAFRRGESFLSVSNLSPRPVPLPATPQVLLTSAPLEGGELPIDASAWLRLT